MKEKWLKDIQKQMADYQSNEPDSLWEDIQKKMSEKNKKHRQSVLLLWTKRFAAAAVAVGFVWTLNHYFNNEKELSNSVIADISDKKNEVTDENLPTSSTENNKKDLYINGIENSNSAKNVASSKPKRKVLPKQEAIANVTENLSAKADESPKSETENTRNALAATQKSKRDRHQSNTLGGGLLLEEIAQTESHKPLRNRFSFGIFTSGGTGASLSNKPETVNEFTVVSTEAKSSMWKDSPLLGTLASSNGGEMETEAKHQLPIRTGLLFTYRINHRFALESGVTYARLVSDLREGSDANYFSSEQRLHYVGLPINLKYKVLGWKGFEVYSSAGTLVEKNISGTLHKTHFFDNQKQQSQTEHIKVKPLQWSVNTSAGIQYNFSSLIGIYAEPGVSYYFSNDSPIKTIYKDKPFNFHLNFGLRFSFGK